MADANLLITYDPAHSGKAQEEIKNIFKEVKEEIKILGSKTEGLIEASVKDARKLIKKAIAIGKKDPSKFEVTYHWIPVDKWCKSTVADMQKTIKGFVKGIKDSEKWKMDLHKRQWDKMPSTELILKLTEVIDKPKVDLKNPEKIIQVEIIGNKAGLALVGADELLNVPKLKEK